MDHAEWVQENNAAANQIYRDRKGYKPRPRR